MMFPNAVRLFNIGGFEVRLDPSWFLIAGLVTWTLATQYFPSALPGQSGGAHLVLAVIAMLGFFGSLLLHELSHALVARRHNLRIRAITLFLFGGVAEIEASPPSAKAEFLIAAAGPALSITLGALLWICEHLLTQMGAAPALPAVIGYVALMNMIIAIFNLVPAFPLDGGRILRAALWARHGDLLRATRTASQAGVVFAFALMGLGVMAVLQGGLAAGLWYVLIGVFVLSAARAAYQDQLIRATFAGKRVSDVMTRHPVSVSPEMTLEGFERTVLSNSPIGFAPVVADGVLIGQIDRAMVQAIDPENRGNTLVGDVYAGLEDAATISPDCPVSDLLARIAATGTRKFLVVDEHDLRGVVTLADLARHLHPGGTAQQAQLW